MGDIARPDPGHSLGDCSFFLQHSTGKTKWRTDRWPVVQHMCRLFASYNGATEMDGWMHLNADNRLKVLCIEFKMTCD